MTADLRRVLFADPEPRIDVGMWFEIEKRKLSDWRLDEPTVRIPATLPRPPHLAAARASDLGAMANVASLAGERFEWLADAAGGVQRCDEKAATAHVHVVPVDLKNYNTAQGLKDIDRKAAMARGIDTVRAAVGTALADPKASLFSAERPALTGVLRCFADLKTHSFSYCVGFPVADLGLSTHIAPGGDVQGVPEAFFETAVAYSNELAASNAGLALPFVAVSGGWEPLTASSLRAATASAKAAPSSGAGALGSDEAVVVMSDHAIGDAPAWAWRNVLSAARLVHHVGSTDPMSLTIVCLRGTATASRVLRCRLDAVPEAKSSARHADPTRGDAALPTAVQAVLAAAKPVGWTEKRLRTVDLSAMLDPRRLAESSAQLNLSLMKWRMMPDLDLQAIQRQSALLLGSGTLGCHVARNLLMWGVNRVTFVDRGSVSYSNPIRQTLFQHSDCTAADPAQRRKADCAAAALRRILPTVDATAVNLTIRMPGHRVDATERAAALADIEQLEELIAAHDVVFLLTDSRESRWLPTLLSAVHRKPVINVALGFDSWVVMRHGIPPPKDQPSGSLAQRLGCYFCADVVAPLDSLTARTLDQQCTVTRPGGSGVASAVAVELLASLCNHPAFFDAPPMAAADGPAADLEAEAVRSEEGVLGEVPHQVRGSLRSYSTMTLRGEAYSKCTACSQTIVDAYETRGRAGFVVDCLNDPMLMEEVTGLAAEKAAMADKHADWDDEGWESD